MTIELTVAELAIGCAFMGGQIAILASVVRSNRDQGRRLGGLEKREGERKAAKVAVQEERKRVRTAAGGVPISTGDEP